MTNISSYKINASGELLKEFRSIGKIYVCHDKVIETLLKGLCLDLQSVGTLF